MSKMRLLCIICAIVVIAIIIIAYQNLFTDLAFGKSYLNYFNYDGAIARFQRVLSKDPNNIEAHIYLSLAYGKRRNYEGFLKEIRWVEEQGIEFKLPAKTHNDIGMIYYLLEMYPQAIKEFKKATKNNPEFAEAYFNLAATFSANGQSQEAIAAYKKVLELEPRNVYAHWNLAGILENTDNIEEAIKHWEKYIEFIPGVFRNPEVEKHLRELKDTLEKQKKKTSEINAYKSQIYARWDNGYHY